MNAKCITDLDLQALVDGELDDKKNAAMFEAISRDPTLYNRYVLYKRQKNLLKLWWKDN